MTDIRTNPTPTECLDILHGILEDEIRQYTAAADKMIRKNEMLAAGQPQGLGKLDRELLTLSQKAAQLEKDRRALMTRMGHDGQTLSDLIPTLPQQEIPRFTDCRERLISAIKTADSLNRDNRDLLTISLQWLQDTIEIIANAITPEAASYTAQGTKNTAQPAANPATLPQSTINHSA